MKTNAPELIRVIVETYNAAVSMERDGPYSSFRTTLTIQDPQGYTTEPLDFEAIRARGGESNRDIDYLIRRVEKLQAALEKSRADLSAQYTRYEESKSKWRKKFRPVEYPESW